MANEENKEQEKDILKTATNSPLIGNQAKPVVLDSTTKLDIDTSKSLVDNIIEAGLNSTLDTGALENFTSISNARDQVYQLIDTMCADSAVSSIVRTYAEDVCETADNGHIVWCESNDSNIAKFVNYLLNVMNVDKNAPKSIHLCDFPEYDEKMVDKELEADMDEVLKIVVLGRAARNSANIKNRQPIGKMYIKADLTLDSFYTDIIKEELNVKEILLAYILE